MAFFSNLQAKSYKRGTDFKAVLNLAGEYYGDNELKQKDLRSLYKSSQSIKTLSNSWSKKNNHWKLCIFKF